MNPRTLKQKLLDMRIPFPVPLQGSRIAYVTLRTALKQRYEPETTALMHRVVRPGMTVADVGTQHGYFTLLLARLVTGAGTVYAFDPDPVAFERMRSNVVRNRYMHVTCINAGVAEHAGTALLYAAELGYGKDSLYPKPGVVLPTFESRITTLDETIPGPIDFFKIDVEGAELRVLKGAARLLENKSLMGVIEFHPRALLRAGEDEHFLPALRAHGFRLYAIASDGSVIEKSDEALRALAVQQDGINIFLRKS